MSTKWRHGNSYRKRNNQQNGNNVPHSQLPGDTLMSNGSQPTLPIAPSANGTNGAPHPDSSAAPGTGPKTHFDNGRPPMLATPPPPPRDVSESMEIDECLSSAERERILEEKRKFDSIKGLLLETINILFREYHVRGLKFFRRRVEDSLTLDELQVASSMLMTLGRFHEVATPPSSLEDDARE